jgi:hypothetical protein
MRNLKMMAFAVLFGAISFVGYVSSIGSSHDMKISGIETSDMLIESRTVRPLRQLIPIEQHNRSWKTNTFLFKIHRFLIIYN